MRCISCIGPADQGEMRFCRDDQCVVTSLVHEAVWRLWQPDEMILVIWDPREAHIASACESRGIQVQKLWIPEGTGRDDLWETFTLLGEVAKPGEEILFDITGGCHAIPFIIAHAAVYLKEVRKVRISGIIYATVPDEHGLRHFADLLPLTGVNDWISGVKSLNESADAAPLGILMNGLQRHIHRDPAEPDPPTRLSSWSSLLGTFMAAVRLSRPVDALYAGWGIIRDLPGVREEIHRFAPALSPIIDTIEPIRAMAAPPPKEGLSPGYLLKQLILVRYQIEKGLDFQAASLSREWLISCTILLVGAGEEWLDAGTRHTASRTLTGIVLTMQDKPADTTMYTPVLQSREGIREMAAIWERVSALRNDLAHCGMNQREETIRSIRRRSDGLPDDLIRFSILSGVITTEEAGISVRDEP